MKLTAKHLTIASIKVAIRIQAGPWIEGVNPDLIKLRPKSGLAFPQSFRDALNVENKSDGREDYFEADCIRLLPDHPLYTAAREVVNG